jgi:hypothetical protein
MQHDSSSKPSLSPPQMQGLWQIILQGVCNPISPLSLRELISVFYLKLFFTSHYQNMILFSPRQLNLTPSSLASLQPVASMALEFDTKVLSDVEFIAVLPLSTSVPSTVEVA